MTIRFGTSGWRALLAEEFTFDHLALVVQAIADDLRQQGLGRREVAVGYDTRFLSKAFAEEAARILSLNQIPVLLANRDVPTPCLSFTILSRKLAGGVNLTASHNPPEYAGIKFSPETGGQASVEITRRIEARIHALQNNHWQVPRGAPEQGIRLFDPAPAYRRHLSGLIRLPVIRKARLRVVVDCLGGTTRDYLDRILKPVASSLEVLRYAPDPTFGWRRPEPSQENLSQLMQTVRRKRAHLGLATDGDSDRFGIVDRDGRFVSPNNVLGLAFEYLIETRGKAPAVARSVSTTHLIDAIASRHGMEVLETPVGFKYLGEIIAKGGCLLAGEESAGLSIRHHLPEKDGILACLLMTEVAAHRRQSFGQMLRRLFKTYGSFYSARIDLDLDAATKEAFLENLKEETPKEIGPWKVEKVQRTDGHKYFLGGGRWLLLRPSGTEPLIRVYMESKKQKELGALRQETERFIRQRQERVRCR